MKLHPEVIPVRGYNRGIIYDLPRHDFSLVPNSLIDFITLFTRKNFVRIWKYNRFDKIIQNDYMDFLTQKEYVFLTNSKYHKLVHELPMQWYYPGLLRRITIDYDETYNMDVLFDVISCVEALGGKILNLRFMSLNIIQNIERLFTFIETCSISQVSLYFDYASGITYANLRPYLKHNPQIEAVYFYNAPSPCSKQEENCRLFWMKNLKNNSSKNTFSVDISMFSEAHYYNVFFNKYLYINTKGDILLSEHFDSKRGSIFPRDFIRNSLIDMLDNDVIHSRKDLTLICRDCEFRYMCCSCRIPTKLKKGKYWQFNLQDQCNYNPYISKWSDEEGYQDIFSMANLKKEKIVLNKPKIKEINNKLWKK